ncbi:hypothetical protein ACA910_012888 [Epithemia clementina (nom. ined.)]
MSIPPDLIDEVIHLLDSVGLQEDVRKVEIPRLLLLTQTIRLKRIVGGEDSLLMERLTDSFLVTTETILQNIRESADVYVSSLTDERQSVLSSCRELKRQSQRTDLKSWGCLADQIAIEFQHLLDNEERTTLDFVRALDSCYLEAEVVNLARGPKSSNLLSLIESLESCLRRKHFLNGHVLRRVSRFLVFGREPENRSLDEFQSSNNGHDADIATTLSELRLQQRQLVCDPCNIIDLVKAFLSSSVHGDPSLVRPDFASALVVGAQGSGKTYTCDAVEDLAFESSISVFRPNIPVDFLGCTVGESEDRLLALFHAASRPGQTSIIILDNIDAMLYADSGEGIGYPRNHLSTRIQSTLFSLMDSMSCNASKVMFVCTAKSNSPSFSRFEYIFYLQQPNREQRKKFVKSCLGIGNETQFESKLTSIAEALVGRSFLEISQMCGEAISDVAFYIESHSDKSTTPLLNAMESCIQRKPQSLRTGIIQNYVDMKVYSGEELLVSARSRCSVEPYDIGMYGVDVQNAWKEIQRKVVLPLCRKDEICELIDPEGQGGLKGKIFCGGILLCGPPGTGKTSLAFEAAKYASSLLPRISLIDVSCTSLIHKEVGGSEQAVTRLFASARQAAPCILLLDGIENIAATRGSDTTTEGSLDRVLSTLLVELDGVEDHNPIQGGIAIIGITQNDDWIDPALMRSGRLSKSVSLGLLEEDARRQIVQREMATFLSTEAMEAVADDAITRLLSATKGMSGAAVVAACKSLMMIVAKGKALDAGAVEESLQPLSIK